jgi:hypothetical protein
VAPEKLLLISRDVTDLPALAPINKYQCLGHNFSMANWHSCKT